jgi:hypothetical protein
MINCIQLFTGREPVRGCLDNSFQKLLVKTETRIIKNSSRLFANIERNFTRSRSGWV